MSARHRPVNLEPYTVQERRARSKGDRHRVHGELHKLALTDLEERDALDGPVDEWVPPHHPRSVTDDRRPQRVWKQRFWKRRSARRAERAAAAAAVDSDETAELAADHVPGPVTGID